MGTLFSFILAFIVSWFAGNAVAHALAIHFNADLEFVIVMFGLFLVALVSIIMFAIAYQFVRHPRTFNYAALGVVLLITLLVVLALRYEPIFGKSTYSQQFDEKSIHLMLEFLVPSWIIILIQWGWVRRRWGRTGPPGAREMAMTRWPWIVTIVALIVVLSPPGLGVIEAGVRQSATDWLRSIWLGVTLGGAAVILVLAWIEHRIRARRIEGASH
jgi:hypothetical protein